MHLLLEQGAEHGEIGALCLLLAQVAYLLDLGFVEAHVQVGFLGEPAREGIAQEVNGEFLHLLALLGVHLFHLLRKAEHAKPHMPRLVPQYHLAAIAEQFVFGSLGEHLEQRHCERFAHEL